jgi:pimeloyl-ACP methyl ester carboxylesterase
MMNVEFANVAGVQTRFYRHGQGDEAVLLLHGVGVSSDSWFWNLEALGKSRVAIAPDMLGFGMTEEGDYQGGPPHDLIVQHLVNLLKHLRLRQVAVVGSSFGANIACHFALAHPALVSHLVLVGCGPALNSPGYLLKMYEASFENGSMAMSDPSLERCRRRLDRLVFKANKSQAALLTMQLTLYSLPSAFERYQRRMMGIGNANALREYDVVARLSEIKCPSLVIWGRQDTRGDMSEAEQNSKNLSSSKFLTFEACGHLPYLEYPDRFNSLVGNFIADDASAENRSLQTSI